MSLDIQYRPKRYEDIVGQSGIIEVLRKIRIADRGFQQSYLFCGSHGSGKTTTARIFAKSLLCESPVDGQACGQCKSCHDFDAGSSYNYVEIDAATNSGKADMKKIVDAISFESFSGSRTIYCMDEAHQLSRDALDALLKPMEDPIRGSDDKQLVCIFCTTEPEKMRATILSRCAPSFVIQKPEIPLIVDRLKYVCESESIPYEEPALTLLVESVKSHMRDALKALGGLQSLGGASMDNVTHYLGLGNHHRYFDILQHLGSDLKEVHNAASSLMETTSPTAVYDNLLEAVMVLHAFHLGIDKIPSFMPRERVATLAQFHGDFLVSMGQKLSQRVSRPNANMVLCDLSILHHMRAGTMPTYVPQQQQKASLQIHVPEEQKCGDPSVNIGQKDGVFAPMKAVKTFAPAAPALKIIENGHLSTSVFFQLLRQRIEEIRNGKYGTKVDSP
jgi:DNA polymerase III subunit gamma/tau